MNKIDRQKPHNREKDWHLWQTNDPDLNIFGSNWMLREGHLWDIDRKLDKIKHYDIMPKTAIKKLRKADRMEIKASNIVEYKNLRS